MDTGQLHIVQEPSVLYDNFLGIWNPFILKVRELTVGAFVELVAVLLVGVELEAVGLWAGGVLGRGAGSQAEENESKCLHGHSAKSTGLHCTALLSRGRAATVQCSSGAQCNARVRRLPAHPG